MKKFISVLLASFAICMLVSCDGAKSQDAANEKNHISSINVHSISYHKAGEHSTNLISGFKFDTIEEPASASDYENAIDKFSVGSDWFGLSGVFDINGTASTTCSSVTCLPLASSALATTSVTCFISNSFILA